MKNSVISSIPGENSGRPVRFLETLSQYKYVDSSGQLLNNTGMIVKDKVEFCSRYKFTIAFENYASPVT